MKYRQLTDSGIPVTSLTNIAASLIGAMILFILLIYTPLSLIFGLYNPTHWSGPVCYVSLFIYVLFFFEVIDL